VRGGQLLMSYTRRFETGAGNIEKLQQFLEAKNLVGKIEKDFRQSKRIRELRNYERSDWLGDFNGQHSSFEASERIDLFLSKA
jgi:hypothetical protein